MRDFLRGEILTNRLAPGTRLLEKQLASWLGVSRGPVREALRLLATEDLVTILPRRGAIVKGLSREEFLAVYQVREALEALAVRLAIPRLTAEDLRTLRAYQAEMVRFAMSDEPGRYFELNLKFHSFLVERSGNPVLREMFRSLLNHLRRYQSPTMGIRGGLERSTAEHEALLQALERRDTEEAVRLMSEHIRTPHRLLEASEASGPRAELVSKGGEGA